MVEPEADCWAGSAEREISVVAAGEELARFEGCLGLSLLGVCSFCLNVGWNSR